MTHEGAVYLYSLRQRPRPNCSSKRDQRGSQDAVYNLRPGSCQLRVAPTQV